MAEKESSIKKNGKRPAPATIGAAGVHFLAGCLSAMGLPVAVTQKNVPSVDLLVSSVDGAKTVSVQVKTMRWAKRPHGCEWRCSSGSLKDGLYAFIDLQQHREDQYPHNLPDFYFVPAAVVKRWPRYRGAFYKPTERQIRPYRNNWSFVRQKLSG